ncbi:phosphatase PAP2 family protein [Lichenihabitans sp. Uapishka_5]|uniref:phosphatase PAP2 family protein n=1 Tax=Lichenihabitans sp. Uapishka_5 TaxID=3037302 RepID=UPI0029E81C22|nr:phosphatase PAP2 family protein [Lichenihabitans sp. Uapishka_5]MDX7951113.1 phosphatase PAP2 family protein [Lichenihabitans sp. Uapishka_5]
MKSARLLGTLWPGLILLGLFGLDIGFFEDGPDGLDPRLILALRLPGQPAVSLGPAWMLETGRDFTALGSNGVIGLLVVTACGAMLCLGHKRRAGTLAMACVTALMGNGILKLLVHRARPRLIPDAPLVFTTSFPSSHAMMSATAFFTLAALVATTCAPLALRRFAFVMAAVGTGLVGASRVYLGVHWPTDVVGGWLAGLFCAWLAWRLYGPITRAQA